MITLTIGPRTVDLADRIWSGDDVSVVEAIQARSDYLYEHRGQYVRDPDLWLAVQIAVDFDATAIDRSDHVPVVSEPGVVY